MKALGIDIGSSSIKGSVLDLTSGSVMTPVARPFPAPLANTPATWIEIDSRAVCNVVEEILSVLMRQAPEATWLGFSGQMGGLVLIDADARPLTHYLSWQDQRVTEPSPKGPSLLEHIRTTWTSSGVFSELGSELQPGSTTALLAWLHAHDQLPAHAIPTNIADCVIAHLVGHPIEMHATHAIGMIDLRREQWHRDAMAQIGLEDATLPPLAFSENCVGECVREGRTLRVFGSYGDQQCALRGAGLERDELSVNISTGSQVSRRAAHFQGGPYQSRRYFFGDTLDTVTHLPAGRSLNVLVDLLTEVARAQGVALRNPWETINALVDEVADTDLNVDLSFFRSPLGDRGRIDHISTGNLSVGNLIYAAFRAMADNYACIAERFAPMAWTGVVLSGGLSQRAPRLQTLLRERFSVPLRESADEETLAGLLDIARNETLPNS